VFKSEVDHGGFDLVLGCNGSIRYIQLGQTLLSGTSAHFPVRKRLSSRPGGCVVVLVHRDDSLELDHCLFLEGGGGAAMPSSSRRWLTGRRNQARNRPWVVPRSLFSEPLSLAELVDHLFPSIPVADPHLLAIPPALLSNLAYSSEPIRPGRPVGHRSRVIAKPSGADMPPPSGSRPVRGLHDSSLARRLLRTASRELQSRGADPVR
jgi:hypothetical protein